MNCTYCGTKNETTNKYCKACGQKLPALYCSACGTPLLNNPNFCPKCGKPVINAKNNPAYVMPQSNNIGYPPQPASLINRGPVLINQHKPVSDNKKRPSFKKLWLILAACCAVFVIILVAVLASSPSHKGVTGRLNTEKPVQVAEGSVGWEGGTIVVDSGGASALDGMTITVPEGAYDASIDFIVSEAPIQSQTFGEDFKPITPLISVHNGEVFAAEPLKVTIPIHLEEGQFAMGFYYDKETSTLEGIPLLDETDSSITLMTRHFSDIYIAMADKGHILGRAMDGIDTGFEPGKNDFIMPNNGSYRRPMGHCAGQSIAAMHYYLQAGKGQEWNGQLYGRFDNNDLGKDTPALWQDDANAMRMCTVMQQNAMVDWHTGADVAEYHHFKNQLNDEKTFYALAYAMMGTGAPQLVYCARSDAAGAHMVLAYKITGDVIYIADPNFPADVGKDRKIEFDRAAAAANKTGPKLTPYYSANSAEEAKKSGVKPYDVIAYYGMYALLDEVLVESIWQDLLIGNDPGYFDFPADMEVLAFTGLKETETGEMEKELKPLEDGLTLYESRLADTAAAGGKLFFGVEYPAELKNVSVGFDVFIGDKQVDAQQIPSMPGFLSIPLQPGENDVGIYCAGVEPNYSAQGYRLINFYRFKVTYDSSGADETGFETSPPAETIPPEDTSEVTGPVPGTWRETLSEIVIYGAGGPLIPPPEDMDNLLIAAFFSGQSVQMTCTIEKNGAYMVSPASPPIGDFVSNDLYMHSAFGYNDGDGVAVSISRKADTTADSAGYSNLECIGKLSADGKTIEGTFTFIGPDTDYDGDWDFGLEGKWTAVLE